MLNGKSDITKTLRPAKRVENSTDATRGEPLALRAQKRRAELELALTKLPIEQQRSRNDIGIAIASINTLLTGDIGRLSDSTAAELSRVLETNKHLGEVNPHARSRDRK